MVVADMQLNCLSSTHDLATERQQSRPSFSELPSTWPMPRPSRECYGVRSMISTIASDHPAKRLSNKLRTQPGGDEGSPSSRVTRCHAALADCPSRAAASAVATWP